MTLRVTAVAVCPAPPCERRSGLLAWLTVEVNGLALDGFTLRRTLEKRPYVGFPKRRDGAGRLHPQVRVRDHRIRQSLVDQILALVAEDFEKLAQVDLDAGAQRRTCQPDQILRTPLASLARPEAQCDHDGGPG